MPYVKSKLLTSSADDSLAKEAPGQLARESESPDITVGSPNATSAFS